MLAIDVQNIVKKFADFTAVNGITFAVEEGEVFGLLGPNGAGKSTLIRMLTTLLLPTSGSARVNGFDVVKQQDDVRRSIGVIPQAMTTDLELSVEENLVIYAKLYGVPREKRKRLINEFPSLPIRLIVSSSTTPNRKVGILADLASAGGSRSSRRQSPRNTPDRMGVHRSIHELISFAARSCSTTHSASIAATLTTLGRVVTRFT